MTHQPTKVRSFFRRSDFFIATLILLFVSGILIYSALKIANTKLDEWVHFSGATLLMLIFILLVREYYRFKKDAKASKVTLQSIIDNIQHSIWAINRDYKLTVYNQKFKDNLKTNYHVEIKPNSRLELNDAERVFWREKYGQCFKGATLSFEKKYSNGRSFHYWLYPLIKKNEITEVMSMSVEITEKEEFYEMSKKVAEYQITALHSVMNPHFLYNSLNSIQYFVAKNERKMALDSLSLFSNLIRKILDSAVTHQISLKSELEILNQYIKLEKIRFEEKFSYSINIDDAVDTEIIKIPSLLIQPYVENAILHGLLSKDEPGFLNIDIKMAENTLIVMIEDNGIGRNKSRALKESTIIKESHQGSLLTPERLNIINQTTDVKVNIEDLENNNKEATGTRVTIAIQVL